MDNPHTLAAALAAFSIYAIGGAAITGTYAAATDNTLPLVLWAIPVMAVGIATLAAGILAIWWDA